MMFLALATFVFFLAEIDTGTTVGTSVGIAGLGGMAWILKQIREMRSEIVDEILAKIQVRQAQEQHSTLPQPLITQIHPEYVVRADFHKHAELNREEYEIIRQEIAQLNQAGEQRGERIHTRINTISERLSEMVGQLKLMNHKAGRGS